MGHEQTEAQWWEWAFSHLSYKAPEQMEHAARVLASQYRWELPKGQVLEKLLGREKGTV